MPYSAVTQPSPVFFKNGGALSSIVAEQSTWVSPILIRQEPSACFITPTSIDTGRISFNFRPEGRIVFSFYRFGSNRPAARNCATLIDGGPIRSLWYQSLGMLKNAQRRETSV
jgi:hypothetical protein